jgi:hypothetical protein
MFSTKEALRLADIPDLINFNNERLKGILFEHTYGKDVREDGFHSTLDGHKVPETIDSSKTKEPPLILIVPTDLLGTHEMTNPPNPVTDADFAGGGFSKIDFSNGWHGPPIAVAAYSEYKGDTPIRENLYKKIKNKFPKEGGIALLEDFEYGDFGVLDGHHRLEQARHDGLDYVPVQVMPPLTDTSMIRSSWYQHIKPPTFESIFRCFKEPALHFKAKITKFGVKGTDGVIRRILSAQPKAHVPLANLRRGFIPA